MDIRNIGIFAHVDAGKTTLSEQFLLCSGAIRQSGSVDSGTAHTDNLPVEQRRGISVKATCVQFAWKHTQIHLIDTPGHVDFSAEVERSFWALDAAVLVVCGVEGVQPQTELLFDSLIEQHIPVIIFINKMDREGANAARVYQQLKTRLSEKACMIIDDDEIVEQVCNVDESLMERYLSDETFPAEFWRKEFKKLAKAGKVFPVLTGSALNGEGIRALLDAIVEYLPAPHTQPQLSGIAFAIQHEGTAGRGVWIRLFGGSLVTRMALTLPAGYDPLTGEMKEVQQKITQMKDIDGQSISRLEAGNIGLVYGLHNVKVGQIIGETADIPRHIQPGKLRTPLITVQAVPKENEQMNKLREACEILSAEDPLLQAKYVRTLNELHLNVMGTIQLEILSETLKTRFGLDVTFTKPAIMFKETLAAKTRGFVAYTMPKPCWAIMEFELEPGPRGSGVQFETTVPVKDIAAQYQHQVEQALPLALQQGRLGWPVTDIRIRLIAGSHHIFHTHPLDFIVATPMGIQDGLDRGGSILLEPILSVRFLIPPEHLGRVMSDVIAMRGEVLETALEDEFAALDTLIPVQTSLEYSTTLASITSGKGSMSAQLHSYRECALEFGATAKRRNVDPLDTSRYILAARNALEGGIFDLD